MKALGVIPARGGSKRVPQKNIRLLGDRPLLEYSIRSAQAARLLDRALISTDDEEVARVARQCGGDIPFMRPAALAADRSPDKPFLRHALEWGRQNWSADIDVVVVLRPTNPFRQPEHIDSAIRFLRESGADSVRSVCKVEGVHHPYWMYQKDENGAARPAVPGIDIRDYYQSQLLPPVFRLSGLVDVIKSDVLLREEWPLYGHDMRLLEFTERESFDIDTMEDLEYGNWLLKKG